MQIIKRILDAHRFFIRESPRYVVGFHDPRAHRNPRGEGEAIARMRFYESYHPIAYLKFMWLELTSSPHRGK